MSTFTSTDSFREGGMTFLHRIQARDRALYHVLLLRQNGPAGWRAMFTVLTHAGGARATIAAALAPMAGGDQLESAGIHALFVLVLSHLAVQLVKRCVGRERPASSGVGRTFVTEPDRFSFPSGHATASLAVALAYAAAFPAYSVPILLVATLVGISRVALGVHYPGDVAAGQAIAVATHLLLRHYGA